MSSVNQGMVQHVQRLWGGKSLVGLGRAKMRAERVLGGTGSRRVQRWAWSVFWETASALLCAYTHELSISCSRSWTMQVSSLASKKLLSTFTKRAMIWFLHRKPAIACAKHMPPQPLRGQNSQHWHTPQHPVWQELQSCRGDLGTWGGPESQICYSIIGKSMYASPPSTPSKGSKRA